MRPVVTESTWSPTFTLQPSQDVVFLANSINNLLYMEGKMSLPLPLKFPSRCIISVTLIYSEYLYNQPLTSTKWRRMVS